MSSEHKKLLVDFFVMSVTEFIKFGGLCYRKKGFFSADGQVPCEECLYKL